MDERISLDFAVQVHSKSFELTFAFYTQNGSDHVAISGRTLDWQAWRISSYFDANNPENTTGYNTRAWPSLSYRGNLAAANNPATHVKFCTTCGTERKSQAKFCVNCGAAFSGATSVGAAFGNGATTTTLDPRQEILRAAFHVSNGASEGVKDQLRSALVRLILMHCLAEVKPDRVAQYQEMLHDDLDELSVVAIIDVSNGKPTNTVNLQNSQQLRGKILSGLPVSSEERAVLKVLLQEAPITFGYWGAMKAALKTLSFDNDPAALGKLAARVAEAGWRNDHASPKCEDVSILERVFPFPSERTRGYVSRLVRRQLRALGDDQAENYLKFVSNYLLTRDGPILPRDYVIGLALFGKRSHLNAGSYEVNTQLGVDELAPYRLADWHAHPEYLIQVFQEVRQSSLAQDFAYGELEKIGQQVTELSSEQVNLALHSSHTSLRQLAYQAIVSDFAGELDPSQQAWQNLLTEHDVSTLELLQTELSVERLRDFSNLGAGLIDALKESQGSDEVRMIFLAGLLYAVFPEAKTWHALSLSVLTPELFAQTLAIVLLQEDEAEGQIKDLVSGVETSVLIALLEAMPAITPDREKRLDWLARKITKQLTWHFERRTALVEVAQTAPSQFARMVEQILRSASLEDTKQIQELTNVVLEELTELTSTGAVNSADARQIIDKLVDFLPNDLLREALVHISENEHLFAVADAQTLFETRPQLRAIAWTEIGADHADAGPLLLFENPVTLEVLCAHLTPQQVRRANPAQLEVIQEFIQRDSSRVSTGLIEAAAISDSTQLAELGLEIIRQQDRMPQSWLRLAESQKPLALQAVQTYLASLKDQAEITDAMLSALDSPVDVTRELGFRMLDEKRNAYDASFVFTRLTESPNADVRVRVAEEALVHPELFGEELSRFDRLTLVTPRRHRTAKELVKNRLEHTHLEETHQEASAHALFFPTSRLTALQDMLVTGSPADQEWAIARLVALKLAGVQIDNVTVSVTSGGAAHV